MIMIPVSAVKCDDYTPEKVEYAVKKALELIGGIDDIIKPGMKVLLKINLIMSITPEHGTTTHPVFMSAMIKELQSRKVEVWVGDSSSWNTGKALKVAGIRKAAEDLGAKVLNFNEFTPRVIKLPEGSSIDEVPLAKPLFDVDLIISLPKLKSHELTGFSGCIKNSFGMIVGQGKGDIHRKLPKVKDFAKGVIDVFMLKVPVLFVMDGIVCVESTAAKGSTKNIGVVLASRNGFALDTIAEHIIGLKPKDLPIPSEAKSRGIIGNTLAEVDLRGEKLEDLIVDYKRPNTMSSGVMKRFHGWFMRYMKQKVKTEVCIKCGVCKECCPVEAIKLDPFPVFDYNKCIHCFCCAEVCNQGAIKIKIPWATKIVGFN